MCFGYSIEFGGPDGFVEEMYIPEGHRGKGIGRAVLEEARSHARHPGVKALHLEVVRSYQRAGRLYGSVEFTSGHRCHLMSPVL